MRVGKKGMVGWKQWWGVSAGERTLGLKILHKKSLLVSRLIPDGSH